MQAIPAANDYQGVSNAPHPNTPMLRLASSWPIRGQAGHQPTSTQLSASVAATAPQLATVSTSPNQDSYLSDLQRGIQLAAARWEPDTQQAITRAAASYTQYMQGNHCRPGLSWETTQPNDLLAYMARYSQEHGVSPSGANGTGPAPSALNSHMSHLRTVWDIMGHTGPWTGHSGNPTRALAVTSAQTGYHKLAARSGYIKRAARGWGYEILSPLLVCMDTSLPTKPRQQCLIRRDQAIYCLLAHTGKRGKDVSHSWATDFRDQQGQPLQPSAFHPTEGSKWTYQPFSKTRKLAPGPPVTLTYTALSGSRETNCLWRLEQYLSLRREQHSNPSNYIFPGSRQGTAASPKTLQTRLRAALAKHQLGDGTQTLHGLRRGLVQELGQAGFNSQAIMQHVDMRSQNTYAMYSNQQRPCRQ